MTRPMPGPRETLARIRKQADAATDGPWEADGLEGTITSKADGLVTDPQGPYLVVDGITMWAESDAAFIAASRTNVPRLVDALDAVLDLHKPVQASMTTRDGVKDTQVCEHCFDLVWPCQTIATITTALEGGNHA